MRLFIQPGLFDSFDVRNAHFVSDKLSFVEEPGEAHILPDMTFGFWEIRIAGETAINRLRWEMAGLFPTCPEQLPKFCDGSVRFPSMGVSTSSLAGA